jgi:hypothetical protein
MTQILNNQFRADPFGFARANPLWPGDPNPMVLTTGVSNPYVKAKAAIDTGETLFVLRGEKRIWSGDLNMSGNRAVLTKAAGAVNAPAMAIYYLPWSKDQVLRTTLRSVKAAALRAGKVAAAVNPPNAAANPPQNTNDPDVFFTANVNGCMVTVEGTREEPTVFHANAMSIGGSPVNFAVHQRDAAGARDAMVAKAAAMSRRTATMSLDAPKVPRAGAPVVAQEMKQAQYQYLVSENMAGAGQEAEIERVRAEIGRASGFRDKLDRRVRFESSVGTVFGVRDNAGLWTFYYQKLVNYKIYKPKGVWSPTWEEQPGSLWYVAECRQFWPAP